MKKCNPRGDAMKQKIKNLNKATEAMAQYAAPVPLTTANQIGHNLKKMVEDQDVFFRCNDDVFKEKP